MSNEMLLELLNASIETSYMVSVATIISSLIGLPLGAYLFALKKISPQPKTYKLFNLILGLTRSIPFIILLLLLIPITRWVIGTSIGTTAAILPLTISAIPFLAKLAENAFSDLPRSQLEMGMAFGASPHKLLIHILLPDALPQLINGITLTMIALIAYSAMAGTVGGGGLGDLAIRYGYQRFELNIMIATVLILVCMVQCIQFLGDVIAKRFSH